MLNKTNGNRKLIIRIIDLKPIKLETRIPIMKNSNIKGFGECWQ